MTVNKSHLISIIFIISCATGYLFNVLFFDKHMSAFDFALQKPSWSVEFGQIKAENDMLSDSPTAHFPYKKEFWEAAKQGYNSQYLPHIFTGKPTSGQGVGIFSTSLFQLFMSIPNALDFSTWFRLLLAGLLMYLFLIQLGIGSPAATLGAVAWAYNMHQIAWLMFPQHLATQLWLPLLLGLNLLVLKEKFRLSAMLGLILTVVFFFSSGYTQIVLYSFVFLGAFNTFYILLVQTCSLRQKLVNWICIHAVYGVAALFLLPEALWQAQEIKEGLRGTQDFRYNKFRLEFSIAAFIQLFKDMLPNAIEVVRFLIPNYKSDLGEMSQIRHIFKSNVVEVQAYFGLICVYLTVYGLVRGLGSKNRLVIVFGIMLLLCMGLFNGNTTIISLLNLIPFAGSGSYARIITLLLLVAIIIAAFGAKFLIEDLKSKQYGWIALAFSIIVIWLASAKVTHRDTLVLHEFIPWIIYLSAFIVLGVVLSRFGRIKLLIPLAVLLTFSELTITGYNFNTRIEADKHFPENTVIQKIRSAPGDFAPRFCLTIPVIIIIFSVTMTYRHWADMKRQSRTTIFTLCEAPINDCI